MIPKTWVSVFEVKGWQNYGKLSYLSRLFLSQWIQLSSLAACFSKHQQEATHVVLNWKIPLWLEVDDCIEICKTVKFFICFSSSHITFWLLTLCISTTHPSELKTRPFYYLSTGLNPSIHTNVCFYLYMCAAL